MANVLLNDTITDQDQAPVAGALAYVYDGTGLATLYDAMGQEVDNPVTTDEDGYWEAWVPEEKYYTTKYYWSGRLRYTNANILAGNPPVGPNSDPNVRLDLASTDEGKGAALSGWKQDDTNAVATTVDARLKGLPPIPSDFGDDGTDATDAIRFALKHFGEPETLDDLTGIGTVHLKPGRIYYVKGSIKIPVGVSIDGHNAIIMPHPDAVIGDFVGGYIFLHNCDESGNQIVSNGGFALSTFQNLHFLNLDENKDPILVGLKAFNTKSHTRLSSILFHGMYGFLNKDSTGSDNSNYTDNIEIRRIYHRRSQGSDWLINIETQGDNLLIEGVTTSLSSPNMNTIRVQKNLGGRISRIINGNVLLERCAGISLSSGHWERGYIEARATDWTFSNSYVWHHKDSQQVLDPVSGSDLGFQCPLRHVRWSASVYPGLLTLDNVAFVNRQGDSFEDTGYSETDAPDLLLEAQANAKIINAYRTMLTAQLDGNRSAIKISRYAAGSSDAGAPATMWENVSHHAAKDGYYSSNRVSVGNREVSIPASYAAFSASSSSVAEFKAPSDTYYYRVVILHGPKDRLIARTTAEFSASPTQDGNAVFINGNNTNAAARPGFTNTVMRIYRGTTTASYDKVVDIPVMDKLNCLDLGYRLSSGEHWKSRPAGDIDSLNTSSTFSRVVVRDEKNCTLYGTTVLPTVGDWVAGDRFIGTKFEAVYTGSAWAPVAGPVETSISATPAYVGQQAVVSGVAYVAVDTSSSGDWKAVTA